MQRDDDDDMAPEYDVRCWKPMRDYFPLTEEDRDYLRGKARDGDARAWRDLAGEQLRTAQQAIIVHWTLVRHNGVEPEGQCWKDAPEYDEIADDRAWFCGEHYFKKKTLTAEEVERAREIMERARALATRIEAIVKDHAAAQGWSDEEFAERREVALYGRRRPAAAPVEGDPDEAHFVRSKVPDGYEERERFWEEEARREAIRLREMAAQGIRSAMAACFAYRVIVHVDEPPIAAQRVRAAFYDGQAQDLGRALEWLTSAEYPEVLEGDQLTGVWEMLDRAEAVHEEYDGLIEAHLASRGDRDDAIKRRRMETAALWAAAA
jgi:hypothetical protein